ncbi:Sec-independent protein translocase subunit TatB, partial [Proteus mirabilis]
MFDIGFSQLLLVMVIGLVFLGPERLPVAVKTIAGWVRALRSLAANVQNELTQELKLQELQESLKKVEEKANLQTLSPELKASMDELKEAAQSLKETYQAPTTPGSTETEQSVKTDSTEPTPSDLAALAEANEANDDVQHSSKTVTENT